MNNVMKKVIVDCDKYRVVSINNGDVIKQVFKVQIKVLFFWITIKEFKVIDYHYDDDFCCTEAKELYYKIVDPYGEF